MMRRTLLKVPTIMEPPQRKPIFSIACKSRGKVFKVIIDSGSTKKLVSLEMVQKLKLRRVPHSFPYKVSWLTKGQKTLVNKQAWVDFQIGNYKDRILCDIVDMDAGHLLFGRPWQYDLQAQNDGKINVYTIKKDGKVIRFIPFSNHEEVERIKRGKPKL